MKVFNKNAGNAVYPLGSVARARMHTLQDLDQMLASFYGFYHGKVNQPYSPPEEATISRIVESITSQLQDQSSLAGVAENVGDFKCPYFRFELPEKHPFSVDARCSCLQQVEEYLTHLFATIGRRAIGRPYSYEEVKILKRIRKTFIRQLKGTDKYSRFKKKCPSPGMRLTAEEKQELIYQQKDELLLNAVSGKITRINPHSEKYKTLKEETIQKIKAME